MPEETYSEARVPRPRLFIFKWQILVAAAGVIVFAILLTVFVILPRLASNKQAQTLQEAGLAESEPFGPPPETLMLACPLQAEFCQSGQKITFATQPAMAFKADPGTPIRASYFVDDLAQVSLSENARTNTTRLSHSTFFNSACYTISYTVPSDAAFQGLDQRWVTGVEIGKVGERLVLADGGLEASVILQVQKREPDPIEFCRTSIKTPETFGEYQPFDNILVVPF